MKQAKPTVDKLKKLLPVQEQTSIQVLEPSEMQRTLGGKMLRPLFQESNFSSFCMSSLKQ